MRDIYRKKVVISRFIVILKMIGNYEEMAH